MSLQIRRCGINSCKNFHSPATKGSNVSFFKIPSQNSEYGKKWVDALKKLTTKFSGTYVCSLHFHRHDIEVFETTTKGIKYVKLKRGALPVLPAEKAATETNFIGVAKETIQFVDIEAIKNRSVSPTNDVQIIPFKPLILQPRLSTEINSTKVSFCNTPNLEDKSKQPQKLQQQQQQPPTGNCAQCKILSVKLKLAEKKCEELEQFIRTNLKSDDENGKLKEDSSLATSMLKIEKCTPNEIFSNLHFVECNGTDVKTEDVSNLNDDDIEYVSTSVLENKNQTIYKENEIIKPKQRNQIIWNNADQEAVSKLSQSVIMHNYYRCNMCNRSKTFKSTSELKTHQKEVHNYISLRNVQTKRFIVHVKDTSEMLKKSRVLEPIASMRFTEKKSIEPAKITLEALETITLFKCGICVESVSFKTSNELQRHIKETHSHKIRGEEKFQYECYICKIKLNGWNNAKDHVKRHVQGRDKKCVVCNEMCTANELECHICGAEKSIQCEYCSESFDATVKLIRHIDTEHATEKILHRCGKCRLFFEMEHFRNVHQKQHKWPTSFTISETCIKGFSGMHKWNSDVEQNSSTRKFLCSVCGRGFFLATQLAKHNEIHAEKSIQCEYCPATFNTKRLLNFHLELHFPVKIKCTFCPKVLNSRRSFQKHTRNKHSGKPAVDKKFACSICSYKFDKRDKLQTHMRSHTGEKPFICEYCPRKYAYKQDLIKHLQIHVGNNIYKCDWCDKGFRLYEELRHHSFVHYKEEREKLGTDFTSK